MAAALHLGLAIPNFGVQEYMRHTPETDAVFPHAWRFADGMLHPGDAPGLGVEIDEALAETFRSEEHTSELQSLMRISYAVFCLKKKKIKQHKKQKLKTKYINTA